MKGEVASVRRTGACILAAAESSWTSRSRRWAGRPDRPSWALDAEGRPLVRRQTVGLPQGEMRVEERCSNVVIEG